MRHTAPRAAPFHNTDTCGRLVRRQPHRYLGVGARKTAQHAAARAVRGIASTVPCTSGAQPATALPATSYTSFPSSPAASPLCRLKADRWA